MSGNLLWPRYAGPGDLAAIETVPLENRGLPASTYEPPRRTDLAAFFHTGGTTGMPKLAAHTHANEVANAWMLAAMSLLDEDSVVFAALPLFRVNALVVTLLTPLFKGQQVVWAGTGVSLVEGYGLTEATCVSARNFPGAPRPGSVGQRLPYHRVSVVAAGTWQELPDGHAGEMPVAYVTLSPGATVTEDELCVWAAEHVPERAAAPKTVTVLDALPVTDVGKPYKPTLRVDATLQAITGALTGLGPGISVTADLEDGAVAVTVTVPPDTDQGPIKATLGQYAIRWTLQARP